MLQVLIQLNIYRKLYLVLRTSKNYENFPGHRFETQVRLNTILIIGTKRLMITNKNNLYFYLKAFQKHLVSSCCVTLFLRRCPTNLTFLVLQQSFFTQMITTDTQNSQVIPNSNQKPLTRSKDLLETLCWKLLYDAIFLSFHDQCDVPSFKLDKFQLDEYLW